MLIDPSPLVIWNRHGIRFVFVQTGELGAFDFATLLLSVCGSPPPQCVRTFVGLRAIVSMFLYTHDSALLITNQSFLLCWRVAWTTLQFVSGIGLLVRLPSCWPNTVVGLLAH
jgi:hypothetical protein